MTQAHIARNRLAETVDTCECVTLTHKMNSKDPEGRQREEGKLDGLATLDHLHAASQQQHSHKGGVVPLRACKQRLVSAHMMQRLSSPDHFRIMLSVCPTMLCRRNEVQHVELCD